MKGKKDERKSGVRGRMSVRGRGGSKFKSAR